jgi:hypothetical protein
MSEFNYKILLSDSECESLASQMLAKQNTIRTTNDELQAANKGYMENNCAGILWDKTTDACKNFKNTIDNKTAALQSLFAENKLLNDQWIDGGCQPSGVGACEVETFNFNSCIKDIAVLVNCSEASAEIMEQCCKIDHQITFYTNLQAAIFARMDLNTSCVVTAWDKYQQVKTAKNEWSDKPSSEKAQAIFNEFKSVLGTLATAEGYEIISPESTTQMRINTTDKLGKNLSSSSREVQEANAFLKKVGHAFCSSNAAANILNFTLPTIDGNVGETTALPYGRSVECSGDTSMPTGINHFCFTPEEGIKIIDGQAAFEGYLKDRLVEVLGSVEGQTNAFFSPNDRATKGGMTLKLTNIKRGGRVVDDFDTIAGAAFTNAEKLYYDMHARILQEERDTIEEKDNCMANLFVAKAAKSGLIGKLDESQHATSLAITDTMQEIIKNNVVSNVVFTYRNCDNTLTQVDQEPSDGSFINMNYLVSKDGLVEIDVAAIKRKFPGELACCAATTPPKTDGNFSFPVTVAATVKVSIPDDALEGIRDMKGFKDLSKDKQDTLIAALQNVGCSQVLNYCIGQTT